MKKDKLMGSQKVKIKTISKATIHIPPNNAFTFNIFLFLADYGYTPYKIGQIVEYEGDELANDFWFSHLIDGTQVDTIDFISGINIKFWVAFKPGEGLYVIILKDDDGINDYDLLHKKIVEEGKLLLTDPEFRIHLKLQEKYFKNEKEIEWD